MESADRMSPVADRAVRGTVYDAETALAKLEDAGTRESVRLLIAGGRGPEPPPAAYRPSYSLQTSGGQSRFKRWLRAYFGEKYESRDDHVRVAIDAALELRRHFSARPGEPPLLRTSGRSVDSISKPS